MRLVKGGQDAAATARVLDIPKATPGNWIRREAALGPVRLVVLINDWSLRRIAPHG